jgi:3-phosphoshikimate 1-carboxyvinyltransferase
MRYALIRKSELKLQGVVTVPSSKSISNRLLILRRLAGSTFSISGLSEAEDTLLLEKLLRTQEEILDCKLAGTTFRFLTAYFAAQKGRSVVLTGSKRMMQRPIAPLVEVLNDLGAQIHYLEQAGFPPIRINGRDLSGGHIAVDATVSSQFISALLMIAPTLPNGLTVSLKGVVASRAYIKMTIALMQQCGVVVEEEGNYIKVNHQSYFPAIDRVEQDWSSASYWYEMAALSASADVFISGLSIKTIQGDVAVVELFKHFGVTTQEEKGGIRLRKSNNYDVDRTRVLKLDVKDCPDLVPAIAVCCAALGVEVYFSGVAHLRFKETDRIRSLQNELHKIGTVAVYEQETLHLLKKKENLPTSSVVINTYGDHRMAMAFAPLAWAFGEITIDQPDVVVKSYPRYWNEMKQFITINQQPLTPTSL